MLNLDRTLLEKAATILADSGNEELAAQLFTASQV